MKIKKYLWFIPVIIGILILPLIYTNKMDEYRWHLLFLSIFFIIGAIVSEFINKKIKINWKKASNKELNSEDTVLLEGIGLFQGVLFIYLTFAEDIVKQNNILIFLKWSIPIFTILFYTLRGYGHIKNSAKFRTYSSIFLIYYLTIEIFGIINYYINRIFVLTIGDYNLIELYFIYVTAFSLTTYLFKIRKALSIRYGLSQT